MQKIASPLTTYFLVPSQSDGKQAPPPTPSEESGVEETKTPTVSSSFIHALIRTGGKSGGKKNKGLKGDGDTFAVASMGIPHMAFRYPDNKPFKFIQTSEALANLAQSNVAFTQAAINWSASTAINQFSSFSAVFDQYKIDMIELWIIPRHTLSTNTVGENPGLLYSVIDYDDSSTLTTAAAYEQYTNCSVSPTTMGHYRKFKPHVAVAAYNGTFSGYKNEPAGWLDCSSTGIQHYGVKYGMSACDLAADEQILDLIYRLHVEFRNVR